MATINLTLDFTLFGKLSTVALTIYFIYRAVYWFLTHSREARARQLLFLFGTHELTTEEALLGAGVELGGNGDEPSAPIRGWRRVHKNRLLELAFVLADEAYLQFGERDKSRANDLITRKFLRDFVSKYDSLRAKDRSRAIEMALTLSYVPPSERTEMEELESTNAYGSVVRFASTPSC